MKAVVLMIVVLGVALSTAPALAQTFNDSFEGNTIDGFWTPYRDSQYGGTTPEPSLSSTQAHSGSQALQLTSNGFTGAGVSHVFSAQQKGNISVYMYDSLPNIRSRYVSLSAQNTNMGINVIGSGFGIGTDDFAADYYRAGCYADPNNDAYIRPRTLGWHHLELRYLPQSVETWFDGQLVKTSTGNFTFNRILLHNGGWTYDVPVATYYFDDFTLTAVPEPSSLLVLFGGISAMSGVLIRRKR